MMTFKQFMSEDGFWFNFDKATDVAPKGPRRKHSKIEDQGTQPIGAERPKSAAQQMGQASGQGAAQAPQGPAPQGTPSGIPQGMPQQGPQGMPQQGMKRMRK